MYNFQNLHPSQQPGHPVFIDGAFSKEEINKILKIIEPLPYHRAKTGDEKYNERRSNVKWLPQDESFSELYFNLYKLIEGVNNKHYGFNLYDAPEPIQYTEYNFDEKGHYGWHMDLGSDNLDITQRKLSLTLLLSDPNSYEGGDLDFFLGNPPKRSKRSMGSALIFPSYLMHRVTPVTKGTRKSLVLWVGGCQFK